MVRYEAAFDDTYQIEISGGELASAIACGAEVSDTPFPNLPIKPARWAERHPELAKAQAMTEAFIQGLRDAQTYGSSVECAFDELFLDGTFDLKRLEDAILRALREQEYILPPGMARFQPMVQD